MLRRITGGLHASCRKKWNCRKCSQIRHAPILLYYPDLSLHCDRVRDLDRPTHPRCCCVCLQVVQLMKQQDFYLNATAMHSMMEMYAAAGDRGSVEELIRLRDQAGYHVPSADDSLALFRHLSARYTYTCAFPSPSLSRSPCAFRPACTAETESSNRPDLCHVLHFVVQEPDFLIYRSEFEAAADFLKSQQQTAEFGPTFSVALA